MEQQLISPKKQKAPDKVKRANAELAKLVREEKEQLRKVQDRHKYMMDQIVRHTFGCIFLFRVSHRVSHQITQKSYNF